MFVERIVFLSNVTSRQCYFNCFEVRIIANIFNILIIFYFFLFVNYCRPTLFVHDDSLTVTDLGLLTLNSLITNSPHAVATALYQNASSYSLWTFGQRCFD